MEPLSSVFATFQELGRTLLTPARLLAVMRFVLTLILVLVGVRVSLHLTEAAVNRFFLRETQEGKYLDERRRLTLSTLTKSLVRYFLYFIAGMIILDQLRIDTSSLLAAAGVGGLAVGFGAQNLIRDVVTGFFILFEDQFAVGDYIAAAGVEGVVEAIGIRVTRIRDFGGQLHIIPNGQITQVTNFMGPRMRVMFDVEVAYETDLDRAVQVLQEACQRWREELPDLVETPEVLGVQGLGASGVSLRLLAWTKPMQQWTVERALRLRVKKALEEAGIEIPYPHLVLVSQERQVQPAAGLKEGGRKADNK